MDDQIKSTEEAVEEILETEESATSEPKENMAFSLEPVSAAVDAPAPIEPAQVQPAKKRSFKKAILIAVVLVVMVGSTAGAYFWRDKVANDLVKEKNDNIASLESEKTSMTKDSELKDANIASLKVANSALTDQQKKKDEYIALLEDENASIAAKAAAATANDSTWRDFSSTDYGFKNQFPGIPYEYIFEFYMNDLYSPAVAFSRSNSDSGYEYYEVEVVDLTDAVLATLPSDESRLYSLMNVAVGYDEGIKIESSELIDFNGQKALKEKFSITYDYGYGETTDYKHGLLFIKDSRMYVIDAGYTTDSNFEKFYKSFSLK